MLREATYPPAAVNVLDVSSESMAAFQVFMYGRFWVFTEAHTVRHETWSWQLIDFHCLYDFVDTTPLFFTNSHPTHEISESLIARFVTIDESLRLDDWFTRI